MKVALGDVFSAVRTSRSIGKNNETKRIAHKSTAAFTQAASPPPMPLTILMTGSLVIFSNSQPAARTPTKTTRNTAQNAATRATDGASVHCAAIQSAVGLANAAAANHARTTA